MWCPGNTAGPRYTRTPSVGGGPPGWGGAKIRGYPSECVPFGAAMRGRRSGEMNRNKIICIAGLGIILKNRDCVLQPYQIGQQRV